MRAKAAVQSPCLDCHQSFLLCVLDPVQGSRGSCGLGQTACTNWARRLLPLRTRATPSWTRTHPHFPGPTETRLSLQPNSVKADLYEYVQGPGILARLPHSIRSITGGGYATARGALPGLSKFSSQASRDPGTEPNANNSATFGGTDGLAPAGQQYVSAESWGAQVPAGPMGVKGTVPAAKAAEAEAVATARPGSAQ